MGYETISTCMFLLQCQIPLENFLEPQEKDPSLVQVYFTNLVQGMVRPVWSPIMHLVAVHHVVSFLFESVRIEEVKDQDVQRVGTQLRLLQAIQTLQNKVRVGGLTIQYQAM